MSKKTNLWDFPEVQWLRLHASTETGTDFIHGWGANIPQAMWCGQKKERKKKKTLGFPPMSGNIFKEYMQINSYTQTEKILTV